MEAKRKRCGCKIKHSIRNMETLVKITISYCPSVSRWLDKLFNFKVKGMSKVARYLHILFNFYLV